jgi:hypothetical protein
MTGLTMGLVYMLLEGLKVLILLMAEWAGGGCHVGSVWVVARL